MDSFADSSPRVHCRDVMALIGLTAYRATHAPKLSAEVLKRVDRRIARLRHRARFNESLLPVRGQDRSRQHLENLLQKLEIQLQTDFPVTASQAHDLATGTFRRVLSDYAVREVRDLALQFHRMGIAETSQQLLAMSLWRREGFDREEQMDQTADELELVTLSRLLTATPAEAFERLAAIDLNNEASLKTPTQIVGYEMIQTLAKHYLAWESENILPALQAGLSRAPAHYQTTFGAYLHWYLNKNSPTYPIQSLASLEVFVADE